MSETKSGLERAVATVARLRGEGGCPWDRAQTHASLRPYLLEETYEVLEALDAVAAGKPAHEHLEEELGDLLLQILLHAEIAQAAGHFDIQSLGAKLSEKLIRRHPHVFGDQKLASPEDVVQSWEKTKAKEKPKESVLDGIPPALPALQQSLKTIEKVAKVGFQWPDLQGPLEKVREELGELETELARAVEGKSAGEIHRRMELPVEAKRKIEAELGDLLFCLANVAYFLHINPEDALRSMLQRFSTRFRHVEKRAKSSGKAMDEMSLEELDLFWKEAKDREN